MMYSPDAGDAAFDPKAKINNEQMSKERFIPTNEQSIIYAWRENVQVERALPRYASTSSRTRSSHPCRFRISFNLSPRTSASAGNGREL